MKREDGYEIVCPDGRVRHYPYTNEDDARADARIYTRKRCRLYPEPSPLELAQPPCTGGEHAVRGVVFETPARDDAQETGQSCSPLHPRLEHSGPS